MNSKILKKMFWRTPFDKKNSLVKDKKWEKIKK